MLHYTLHFEIVALMLDWGNMTFYRAWLNLVSSLQNWTFETFAVCN